MTSTQLNSYNQKAIQEVKKRFIRLPSNTTFPRFRDVITNIEQADTAILVHHYRQHTSQTPPEPHYLANSLDWVYGEGFTPNGSQVLSGGLLNLWTPPSIESSSAVVSASQVTLFIEFLKRWFPNDLERHYFTWWLAHSIRKPEKRIIATPVLRSEHGIGKGFLAETLLSKLIGKSSVAVCGLKDVVGDFNDVIAGKTLLLIDEVYKSKKSTTDALKSFQGNATIPLHRKHKPTITINNYINFIITSNDHVPIMLEKGDRRFWIPEFIRHKENQQETSFFINNKLKPWLLYEGGFQLVRDYLQSIDLTAYNATDAPPATVSKSDLMGFSTADKLEEVLTSAVESTNVITLRYIKDSFSSEFDKPLTDMAITSVLLSLGCQKKNTKAQRYYITPAGLLLGVESSTPKELEAMLPSGNF